VQAVKSALISPQREGGGVGPPDLRKDPWGAQFKRNVMEKLGPGFREPIQGKKQGGAVSFSRAGGNKSAGK